MTRGQQQNQQEESRKRALEEHIAGVLVYKDKVFWLKRLAQAFRARVFNHGGIEY